MLAFGPLGSLPLGGTLRQDIPPVPPAERRPAGGQPNRRRGPRYIIFEERKEEIAKIERQAKKAVAAVIHAPGILSEDLTTIVRNEVETPQHSWLTPDMISFIVTRIEAQFRRAFIQKQEEDDEEDAEVLLLA